MKKVILCASFAALIFASCSKDSTTTPTPTPTPTPTKAQLLSQKNWQIKSAKFVRSSTGDTLNNVNIVGSNTWRLAFKADSTGTATGTIMQTGAFTWKFTSTAQNRIEITKTNKYYYDVQADTLLIGNIPNLTLTLVDGSGNPTGVLTGTLIETYNRVQ